MRILYVVPRYWPSVGGAQVLARQLIHRMSQIHDVEVVTQFTRDEDSFGSAVASSRPGGYLDGAIQVRRVGPTGIVRPVLSFLGEHYERTRIIRPFFAALLDRAIRAQLMRIIRTFRADIVHAVHVGLVYSSETARWAARRAGVPFVWTPLPHIEGGSGWRGRRFRRLYRRADAIIAMTRRERDWLTSQGAAPCRVSVVPAGPLVEGDGDADAFRRDHRLGRVPVVMFLGQKLGYKGYEQMVASAPLVWCDVPDACFVFVGPRTPESTRFFGAHQDSRIIELPAVEERVKASALAACDVFCMPSTQESLGIVYLEAWSYRKPVIAADIEVMREVVRDGHDGILVDQAPESIASAILMLLKGQPLRERLGEAGHVKVLSEYDWDVLAARAGAVYASVLDCAG